MIFFENMNEDYYPIDALNKQQFTFKVESPILYMLDFQEFCMVACYKWKDFLNTVIMVHQMNKFVIRNCL